MNIVQLIERFIPSKVLSLYRINKKRVRYFILDKMCFNRAISKIREKKAPINVIFLAILNSNWKYDYLYRLMDEHPKFNPIVLVCPIVNSGHSYMIKCMDEAYDMFVKKGMNVIKAYNIATNKYVNLRDLQPDIIFYTNPYKGLIDNRYYIDKFRDVLSCYMNYSFEIIPNDFAFNTEMHQRVWRYFVETPITLNIVKKLSPISADNVVVTGYPVFDSFATAPTFDNSWKIKNKEVKRIIWAPHQSIKAIDKNDKNQIAVQWSTFLLYADFMLGMAKKYRDKIQMVFKPHTLLKINLYDHPDWGKEKTDAYYEQWINGENTSLVEGEYLSLFNSSDALMHDCGSFTAEYLYQNKPVLYLSNYVFAEDWNEIGKLCYDAHYKAFSSEDIEAFVKNVILDGKDDMAEIRSRTYNEQICPPNGRSASENIVDCILGSIYK